MQKREWHACSSCLKTMFIDPDDECSGIHTCTNARELLRMGIMTRRDYDDMLARATVIWKQKEDAERDERREKNE